MQEFPLLGVFIAVCGHFIEVIKQWTIKREVRAGMEDKNQKSGPRGRKDADPPLLYEEALKRTMGDRDFLLEMLREFLQHLPGQVEEINRALEAGDAEGLRAHSHSIKGAAYNMSAVRVADAARQLEDAGREEELDKAPGIFSVLNDEIEQLKAFAEEHFFTP